MRRALPWLYFAAMFVFIYLPVGALVLFSFQSGGLPVPPFDGPSLRWYGDVLGDDDLTAARRRRSSPRRWSSGRSIA